jgi:DNA-binding CsgD family transcriptional regulator
MYAATAHRCRALVESDVEEIERAIELIKHAPRPVEVAGYYEDGAVIMLRAGHAGRARPLAQEAADRYVAAGAKLDEQRLRDRLGEFGFSVRERREAKPVTGWGALTETESYVAELVATGKTSAVIAEQMGVSRRTVESHLYRIYPKLGVANRVELIVASANR